MNKWAGRRKKERDIEINLVMIAANNHYVGFGLLTTNIFRKIVGPLELSYTYEIPLQQQTG